LFLGQIYKINIRLAGMIYLHKITDNRMTGSALMNLHMFEELCGPKSMSNIVLATTMWEKAGHGEVSLQEAEGREKLLLSNKRFWGHMVQQGSLVFRHDGTKESAWKMVHHILSKNSSVSLAIQTQLVDDGKPLEGTNAGRILQKELLESQQKHEKEMRELSESMATALKNKEFEAAAQIQQLRVELETKNSRTADELESLKINMQRMLEDKDRFHVQELQLLEQQRKKQEAEMRAREKELMDMERKVRDLQFQMEHQALTQKGTMDQIIRMQSIREESEEQTRKREADIKETLNQERALQEMRLDEERRNQAQLQKEMMERAAELRKTNATKSIVQVLGGVGLAAVGAFTSNHVLGAAGLEVIGRGLTS